MLGMNTLAPAATAFTLPSGSRVCRAVEAAILMSFIMIRSRAIILRLSSRRSSGDGMAADSCDSGVAWWGMYGPMPTMSMSRPFMKMRSPARSAVVCHGKPIITPVPV